MQNKQKDSFSLILITDDLSEINEFHKIIKKIVEIGFILRKKSVIPTSKYD